MAARDISHPDMQLLYPGVYRIFPTRRTPTKYTSLFVRRKAGNLLFPCVGGHSSFEAVFDTLDALGGVSMQLIGDMHFAASYNDDIAGRFGVPAMCSEPEAADVRRKVERVQSFPFTRQLLAPGVEAIPTPGHRVGAASYLVTLNRRRYLFAGDTLYHDGSRWRAYVSKPNRKVMLATLQMLAEVPFDVLLANTGVSNPVCSIELDADARRALLAEVATTF